MKVGYKRISSKGQNLVRQLDGIKLDKAFEDIASGSAKDRQALKDCLSFVRDGDELFIHSLDRLGRSLIDLNNIVKDLIEKGVVVHFVNESLTFKKDSQDSVSMLLFNVLASFAEFERSIIKERQKEGIEKAKERGVYKGRKKALAKTQIEELINLKEQGVPITKLAKKFEVSRSTIYAYLEQKEV